MVASPVLILLSSMAILRSNSQDKDSFSVPTTLPLTRRDFGDWSLRSSLGLSMVSSSVVTRTATTTTSTTTAAASAAATTVAAGFVVDMTAYPLPTLAFDGSGSTALAGYNPSTKAEKVRGYKQRVIADVCDFNRLGQSLTAGEPTGDKGSKAWVNFFIPYQRREPDEFGRTYAALVDLRGLPTKKKYEYEGGDGLLLATSFTKPGKPSENTPAVKSWNKLFKTFDAIEMAGKKGDAGKARVEWEKTKPLLEQFLLDVELPGDLNDPLYN